MTRLTRNTAILAKIETTYGVDSSPTGAANALLISNANFEVDYTNVSRDLMRGYMGGFEQLAGTRYFKASFDVEIAGSGTAGTAPALGPLLRACAMAETTAAGYVEYTPVSVGLESLTIKYCSDGLIHTLLGCLGDVEYKMGEGDRPLMTFNFIGIDGGNAVAATPALTLTAWKSPLVIQDASSGDIKFGTTYAAGVLSGGTPYPSRGINVKQGNSVQKMGILGGQSVDITQREVAGSFMLSLTAAQQASMQTDVQANTLTSISFEHGTVAGGKVALFAPAVQRINPKETDYQGRLLVSYDLRLTPLVGNDELRVVFS